MYEIVPCLKTRNYFVHSGLKTQTYFVFVNIDWDPKKVRSFFNEMVHNEVPDDDPVGSKHVAKSS